MLIKYNEAFPDCAERIVAMAERQAGHRQAIEKAAVDSNVRSEKRGQFLGFLIALAVMLAGVYLTMNNKPTAGLVAIIGPVVALSGLFVYSKREQRKQLERKNPQIKS